MDNKNEGFLRRQKHLQTSLIRKKNNKDDSIAETIIEEEEKIILIPINKDEINNDCLITVGMPLYNMGQIATIALESLCNQKTNYNWELIVCEEQNEDRLGKDTLYSYKEKLEEANCVRIIYIPLSEWVPLGEKWKIIASNASNTIGFILQAGDCYAHSERIESTTNAFLSGYTYYDESKGFFYSFRLKKTILFDPDIKKYNHPCKLNMAWKTNLIKKLNTNNQKMNVDGFLYRELSKIEPIIKYSNNKLHMDGVDLDGYNIISSRNKFFVAENNLFKFTDVDMTERLPILKNYFDLNLTVPMKEKL